MTLRTLRMFYSLPYNLRNQRSNCRGCFRLGHLLKGFFQVFRIPLPVAGFFALFFLLSACNGEYGTVGTPVLSQDVVGGGDMTLVTGVPGGQGTADGVGEKARFNDPWGITAFQGNLYIADTDNHAVRKLDLATGRVTTVAGFPGRIGTANGRGTSARFNNPEGITTDGNFLYVSDTGNYAVRKISLSTFDVTTLAGRRGQFGYLDSTNGRGDSAQFRGPAQLAVVGTYLYVADRTNHAVRRVDIETGETVTIAGFPPSTTSSSGTAGTSDGIGTTALFNAPLGMEVMQEAGGPVIYLSEEGNHSIRRLDLSTLAVTTVAGKRKIVQQIVDGETVDVTVGDPGFADGPGLEAKFNAPSGMTVMDGKIYIADRLNFVIREYDPVSQEVRTIAGIAEQSGSNDGGPGSHSFHFPAGLAALNGFLYIADQGNHAIRRLEPATGEVITLSGMVGHPGSEDGDFGVGRFLSPLGLTRIGSALYVTDSGNHTIRRVDLETGTTTTAAGTPGVFGNTDSTVSPARFNFALSSTDSAGTTTTQFGGDVELSEGGDQLFIADTFNHAIRGMFLSTGQVETFIGFRGFEGYVDGVFADARFRQPMGMVRIGDFLYVTDRGNHAIRQVRISTREVTTLAGSWQIDSQGNRVPIAGQADGIGENAFFNAPQDITTDGTFIYVADTRNHTIRRVDPSSREVVTIVGTAGQSGLVDSSEGNPRLNAPAGVLYHNGFLYVSDSGNYLIRKVNLATGEVSFLAGDKSCVTETTTENNVPVTRTVCAGQPIGTSSFVDSTDQTGKTAAFGSPAGLAADDYLYVMDSAMSALRQVDLGTGETHTIAGGGGFANGDGRNSRFYGPMGVALVDNHLYFIDSGNSVVRLADISGERILTETDPTLIKNPIVTTLAGNVRLPGSVNSEGYAARFFAPTGIATDGTFLYIADNGNHIIRKMDPLTGGVTTLVGVPLSAGYVNSAFGIGLFNGPTDLVYDDGHLFIVDSGNHAIRRYTFSTGRLSLVAGHGDERTGTGTAGTEDSTGQAAGFSSPRSITADKDYLYVTDTGNHSVRRILKATGQVRTLAGMPHETGYLDSVGFDARFNVPWGITNDDDFLYVADFGNNLLRRIDKTTREVVTLTGGYRQASFATGSRPEVRFNGLSGITTTPDSPYIYTTDYTENVIGRVTK